MNIEHQELLTDLFGRWPSFHDAEVRRLTFLSADQWSPDEPVLEAQIRVFEITSEVGPRGMLVLKHDSLATVRFLGVCELKLTDFRAQNSLMGLAIEDITSRQLENQRFAVRFDGSMGFDMRFLCRRIVIDSVEPVPASRA